MRCTVEREYGAVSSVVHHTGSLAVAAYLYPQNSTAGLFGDEKQELAAILAFSFLSSFSLRTHFFMIIHRRRFPSVWSSSRMQYVAPDRSSVAPGS